MPHQPAISVVIPFYNAETYLKRCIKSLQNQTIKSEIEIIFVDDGSTDNSLKIVNKCNLKNLKIFRLKKNSGPAVARNLGILKSSGEYLFFLDADDTIEQNTLRYLYKHTKKKYDYIFCDSKWIETSKNQRKRIYSFNCNKVLKSNNLTKLMIKRLYSPNHMGGPLSAKARLLKRSLIINNKIFFEKKLRYLEDEIFMWDFLSYVKNAKYIKKQFYIYYVNPNVETAVIRGLNLGFTIKKFKIIKQHIFESLKRRKCKRPDSIRYSDQALIYFIINVLISYSKSILHKKVDIKKGRKIRSKMITQLLEDRYVGKAIKNYSVSKSESFLIVKAIKLKSKNLLEIACDARADQILSLRRKT